MIVVRPTAPFQELAETVALGLERLGRPCSVEGRLVPADGVIVLGAHVLSPNILAGLPSDAILYNLEQVHPEAEWLTSAVRDTFMHHQIWDYSRRNCQQWNLMGFGPAIWVPVGYVPELSRIAPASEPDLDLLFYGTPNGRRLWVLDKLKSHGIQVVSRFNIWGRQRDELISRAKLVLNVHFYPIHILEIVRVSYLLANHKAVVAECDPDTEIEDDIRDGVCAVPYDDLVDACRRLLAHPSEREALAERGFTRISARDEVRIMEEALGQSGRIS